MPPDKLELPITSSPAKASNRRHWPQFSLRVLLMAIAACCVGLAWFARNKAAADAQAEAVPQWKDLGLYPAYDTELQVPTDVTLSAWSGDWQKANAPSAWARTTERVFGRDFCSDVVCLLGFESGSYPPTEAQCQLVKAFPRLQAIDMFDSAFSVQVLENCQEHRDLVWLSLIRMGLADKDLEVISRLPRIQRLNLDGNDITDAGALRLRRMKSLKLLTLGSTQVTPAGIAGLRAELAGCEVLDDAGIQKKWPRP